jgi:hypothetical protein
MVVGMELRCGNLHACTERDASAAFLIIGMKLELAEDNPRGYEILTFPTILPGKKPRSV